MLSTRRVGFAGASLLALLVDTPLPAAQLPAPTAKCGTPQAAHPAAPPTSGRSPMPGDPQGIGAGRYPGVATPVSLSGVLPAEVGSTAPQAMPPVGAPPPAVPGLSGAKTSNKNEKDSRPRVEAIQAQGEIPEERLLDVGVEILNPGVQETDREKLARRGLSPELRRSEARFISFHLKKTLESTGNWGAVRVVPGAGEGLDLTVSGRIVESNGKHLTLDILARDALGQTWLDKRYRGDANPTAYKGEAASRREAFQDVYNRIANDLLHAKDDRDASELVTLRRIATLRFAAQLAPEAFSSYLKATGSGRFTLMRIPADDDSMMHRVAQVRERDQMFVDTLNDHYQSFNEQMSAPYASWRQYSYEEIDALDKIKRDSLIKKLGGAAAILAGMLMPANSQGGRMAGDVMVLGGMAVVQKGFEEGKESGVHTAALKELANSFDGDVAPLLVEVEGQQLKLTGSAETQFSSWRELLRQVFAVETGKPDDPNAKVVAAPPSSR